MLLHLHKTVEGLYFHYCLSVDKCLAERCMHVLLFSSHAFLCVKETELPQSIHKEHFPEMIDNPLMMCASKCGSTTFGTTYKKRLAWRPAWGGLVVLFLPGMREVLGLNPLGTKTLCWLLLCSHFLSSKLFSLVCHSSYSLRAIVSKQGLKTHISLRGQYSQAAMLFHYGAGTGQIG